LNLEGIVKRLPDRLAMLHQKLICSTAWRMIRNGLEVSRNKAMHVYWMQLSTFSLCFIKAKMGSFHSDHKCFFVVFRFFRVFHIVCLSFCFCLGFAIASPLLPCATRRDEGKLIYSPISFPLLLPGLTLRQSLLRIPMSHSCRHLLSRA